MRSVQDLDALPSMLQDLSRPLLLNCHVTQNVRAGWLEEAFQRAAH